jgi:hypothetical protein
VYVVKGKSIHIRLFKKISNFEDKTHFFVFNYSLLKYILHHTFIFLSILLKYSFIIFSSPAVKLFIFPHKSKLSLFPTSKLTHAGQITITNLQSSPTLARSELPPKTPPPIFERASVKIEEIRKLVRDTNENERNQRMGERKNCKIIYKIATMTLFM